MKFLSIPILATLFLCACSTLQQLDPYAVTGLTLITNATSALKASGAISPTTSTGAIINDVNTVSAGLETILSGQPLTTQQASAVATSFKSNSSTSNYIALATPIVNAVVAAVNSSIAAGNATAQAQTAGVQVLVNAPSAVQAGLTPAATTACLERLHANYYCGIAQ